MARQGYDEICAHNLHGLYHIDKLPTDSCTSFDDEKMCECTQISYEKCDDVSEYSCEKNVNDVDFDANINRDMCMEVMFIFIDIKLRVVDKYVCLSMSCVLLFTSFMCIIM